MHFFRKRDKKIISFFLAFFFIIGFFGIAHKVSADTAPPQSTGFTDAISAIGTVFKSLLFPPAAIVGIAANTVGGNASNWVNALFAYIAYALLWIFSLLVGLIGGILNIVIQYTLINMNVTVQSIGAIDVGWAAIRDLCNIFFIFILIYIAIGIIIGLDEHSTRGALVKLILVAVLINFSLFFTKVIIDATNILAIEFYSKIHPANGSFTGFGDAIMGAFRLPAIYSQVGAQGLAGSIQVTDSPIATFIMGIIMMITVSCVMLAAIIIFVKRFVSLIFLMMTAPAGFAGMIIHSTEHFAHEWWEKLMKEALAAPIFMIIFWLAFGIMGDQGFHGSNSSSVTSLGASVGSIMQNGGAAIAGQSLAALLGANVIFNFAIVTAIMVTALVAVEHLGASGGVAAEHFYAHAKDQVFGWIGGQTIGRAASTLINKTNRGDNLRNAAAGVGTFNDKSWAGKIGNRLAKTTIGQKAFRTVVGTADKVGANSFGGHHTSFAEQAHENEAWFQAAVENAHGNMGLLAQIYNQAGTGGQYSMDRKSMDDDFHHRSKEEKANVMLELQDIAEAEYREAHKKDPNVKPDVPLNDAQKNDAYKANAALTRLFLDHGHGRLNNDEQSEIPRMLKGSLTYYDNKLRHALDHINDPKDAHHLTDVLMNFQSSEQILSALKTMGTENMKKFEGGSPLANALRTRLTDVTTNKFDSEAAFSNAAKDSIFGKDMKSAISGGGWKKAATYSLYAKINEEINNNGSAPPGSIDEFIYLMDGIESMKADMVTFNQNGGKNAPQAVLDLLKAYAKNEGSIARPTYKYFTQTNASRSQAVSGETEALLQKIANLTKDDSLIKNK